MQQIFECRQVLVALENCALDAGPRCDARQPGPDRRRRGAVMAINQTPTVPTTARIVNLNQSIPWPVLKAGVETCAVVDRVDVEIRHITQPSASGGFQNA